MHAACTADTVPPMRTIFVAAGALTLKWSAHVKAQVTPHVTRQAARRGMRISTVLATVSLSFGCRGAASLPPTSRPASLTAATENAAKDTTLPVAPPFARPGERLGYSIALHNIEVAAFTLQVGELTEFAGRKAVAVAGAAQSIGMAAMLEKVDDRFVSIVDAETGRPLQFSSHEGEGAGGEDGVVAAETRFYQARDGAVPVLLAHAAPAHGQAAQESQRIAGELWDMNSFLLALRSCENQPGARFVVDVVRSRFAWRARVQQRGRELVDTPLGRFAAVRFDGVSEKLLRDGSVNSEEQRKFSIWISDDADRVPIALVARTYLGDVKMMVSDYTPGRGARLFDGMEAN